MELIDEVVDAFRATQRANATLTEARDALDAYLTEHPGIREEAEIAVSNAIAAEASKHLQKAPPGEHDTGAPADEA